MFLYKAWLQLTRNRQITPLFWGGGGTSHCSGRPTSNMPLLDNTLEHMVASRLQEFLNEVDYWHLYKIWLQAWFWDIDNFGRLGG